MSHPGQARAKYRQAVYETLTGWHFGCTPPRHDGGRDREIIRAGLAEILALRLGAAYTPVFQTLTRIENRLAVLASLRSDPWAPPPKPLAMPEQVRAQPSARPPQVLLW